MLLRTRSFPTDLRASGLSESPYSRALTTIGDGDSRRLQQVLADKRSKTLLQESGAELLCTASEKGATGCVEVLLRAGCNPNSAGPGTTPPLIASAQNGHSETVKWLLNRGADPCLTDDHGNTALHQALRYGRIDCVEVLLDSRARVDAVNDDGNTLLHMAVLSNLAETLRSLLAHLRTTTSPRVTASIINHQNNQGSTALHEAAAEGFKPCLEVLCACPEIDLEICDNQGLTAAAQTASDNCQLLITSRDLREAVVLVEVEGSSRARWAVGRLELLQHHTWRDLEVLCDDVLIQYCHFLQGRQGVALRHSRTPPVLLSIPPTSGKVSERLLELLQANSHELLKQMDLIVKQRAKCLVSLGLSPSSISMCQIGTHCYAVPSGSSGEYGTGPRTGPYQALLELTENGELPEVIVTLRDLDENSLDRLSFTSMIPAPSLHNYISQLQKHKAVMIHGSLENGHTSLARHLASFIETRSENAKVISVHMHADFTRANLLSLLYNSGALLYCPSSKQQRKRTVVFILENMERLKQSAVLTELLAVLESRDNGGQPLWVDTVAGDGEMEDYEPLLPAGQYYVSQHCYFILTRTAYTRSNKALPKAMTEHFSHIWLTESSEPAAGHLLRHLLRDVVHANNGVLPSRMDVHYQAVVWVWQLWLLYNHYIQLLDLHELSVGPRLFLTCPAISGQADSVYDWLCEMWNFHIVPRVRDAIHHGNHPHKKSKNDTSRLLLAFLTQRLMQISSPLSPEDTQMVLQNLEGVVEMGTPHTPQSPAKRKISPTSTFSKNSPIVKRMSKLFSDEKSEGGSPKHRSQPSSPLAQDDNRRVRPRSSTSIFSKSGMRRRSTLKGSKPLTSVEEEEAERRKHKHRSVDHSPKDIDDLFDMLVKAGSGRLEEQRMPMTGISQSTLPPHHVLAAGSPDGGEGSSGEPGTSGRRPSQHSSSPAGTPTQLPVRHGRKLSIESSSTNSSPDVVHPPKMQAASPLHVRSNSDEGVYYQNFKRSMDELHQSSSLLHTDSSDVDEHLQSNTSLSRSKDTVGEDSLAGSSVKDSPRDSGHYDEDEWVRTAPVLPDSQSRNSCALLFTAYSATLGFCLSNSAIRSSSLPAKRNGSAGATAPGRRTSLAVDALHHWGEGVDL